MSDGLNFSLDTDDKSLKGKQPKLIWNLEHRVFCVEHYFRSGKHKVIKEKFKEQFQTDTVPHKTCILKWVRKFRTFGNLGNLPSAIDIAKAKKAIKDSPSFDQTFSFDSSESAMSSQKGNVKRTRTQKHANTHGFKNNLHDKSNKTKFLNNLTIDDVCERCQQILEWKIKYKKYKLLKNPGTCVKCQGRNVTLSYRIMCKSCSESLLVCPKCGKSKNDPATKAQHNKEDSHLDSSSSSIDSESEEETEAAVEGLKSKSPPDNGFYPWLLS